AALPSRSAVLDLGLARIELFTCRFLIVAAKRAHVWPRDEFANIFNETFAIIIAAIRPKRECGVPQAAQIAHGLTICGPAKMRIVQDRLFQLGVSDMALRHRRCGASRA